MSEISEPNITVRYYIPASQADELRKTLSLWQVKVLDDFVVEGGALLSQSVVKVWVGELKLGKSQLVAAPPPDVEFGEIPLRGYSKW